MPAFSTPVAPETMSSEPSAWAATPSTTAAGAGAATALEQTPEVSDAQLVERHRQVEVVLKSPTLHRDQ